MVKNSPKFPVEKPYVKVPKSYGVIGNNSSLAKSGPLSYSYSCVQEFRKNQHTIRNLVALQEEHEYNGLEYQPFLFSLSGERDKPICQPFYSRSSTLSESEETSSKFTNINCNVTSKRKYNDEYYSLKSNETFSGIQNTLESGFSDKSLLLQWFKYQLKYVNSLWPFSMTKDNFFSKLCKKNRQMKMEMLLNNIDEETKYRLKKYVNGLSLNLEERCSLCSESIIEIDITPILEDTQQLHAFLMFIKNIESKEPVTKSTQYNSRKDENRIKFENKSFEEQNIEEYSLLQPTKDNSGACEKTEYRLKREINDTQFKSNGNIRENKPEYPHFSVVGNPPFRKVNSTLVRTRPFNQGIRKRGRLKSTIAANQQADPYNIDDRRTNINVFELTGGQKEAFELQPKYLNYKRNNIDPEKIRSDENKNLSEGLMEQNNYNRIINEGLYANGDKINNGLTEQFISIRDNTLKPKTHSFYLNSKRQFSEEVENGAKKSQFQFYKREQNKTDSVLEKQHLKQRLQTLEIKTNKSQPNLGKQSNTYWNPKEKIVPRTLGIQSDIDNSSVSEVYNEIKPGLKKKFTASAPQSDDSKSSNSTRPSYDFSDSSGSNFCYNKYHMVSTNDVEELVHVMNYTANSSNSDSCFSSKITNSAKSPQSIQNPPALVTNKKISFNACFESLNYSITSAWNNSPNKVESCAESNNSPNPYSHNVEVFEKRSLSDSTLFCTSTSKRSKIHSNKHVKKDKNLLKRIGNQGISSYSDYSDSKIEKSRDKKHLKLSLLKPKNLYGSISSVFKGNKDKLHREDRGEEQKKLTDKSNQLICKQKQNCSSIKYKNNTNRTFTESQRSDSPQVLPLDSSSLILSNLEKLYFELRNQRDEIKSLKILLKSQAR